MTALWQTGDHIIAMSRLDLSAPNRQQLVVYSNDGATYRGALTLDLQSVNGAVTNWRIGHMQYHDPYCYLGAYNTGGLQSYVLRTLGNGNNGDTVSAEIVITSSGVWFGYDVDDSGYIYYWEASATTAGKDYTLFKLNPDLTVNTSWEYATTDTNVPFPGVGYTLRCSRDGTRLYFNEAEDVGQAQAGVGHPLGVFDTVNGVFLSPMDMATAFNSFSSSSVTGLQPGWVVDKEGNIWMHGTYMTDGGEATIVFAADGSVDHEFNFNNAAYIADENPLLGSALSSNESIIWILTAFPYLYGVNGTSGALITGPVDVFTPPSGTSKFFWGYALVVPIAVAAPPRSFGAIIG